MLDNFSPPAPQSLVGLLQAHRHPQAARYSRFGLLANPIRTAAARLRELLGPPPVGQPGRLGRLSCRQLAPSQLRRVPGLQMQPRYRHAQTVRVRAILGDPVPPQPLKTGPQLPGRTRIRAPRIHDPHGSCSKRPPMPGISHCSGIVDTAPTAEPHLPAMRVVSALALTTGVLPPGSAIPLSPPPRAVWLGALQHPLC